MSVTCPTCNAPVAQDNRFCPSCGARLIQSVRESVAPSQLDYAFKQEASNADSATTAASAALDIHPLPAVPVITSPRKRRSRPRARPWYRRKLFIVPFVLLVLLAAGAAGTLAYLNSQFDAVNTISTPPPELSSDRLGGEEGLTIDTGAAQEAVREAEEREGQLASNDKPMPADVSNNGSGGNAVAAPGSNPSNAATPLQSATSQLSPQPATDGSVTILLMGVDARPGEPIDVEVRPDTLAVLHLDGESGSCRLLSVPRDTRTELPGYGLTKVNHALAVGGIPYQMLVTQHLLGIEIDHFGLIDFSGIEGLVDAVGGVTVMNEEAFTVGSTTFESGTISLDGDEALAYARYRGGADGDFGRIDRQQQIVRALISQTSGMDAVTGAYNLLGAVEGHVKTDLSITDLIGLANDYRSTCTEATLELDNLDGTVATYPDPLLNMDLSFVVVDRAEIEQKIDWLLGTS